MSAPVAGQVFRAPDGTLAQISKVGTDGRVYATRLAPNGAHAGQIRALLADFQAQYPTRHK